MTTQLPDKLSDLLDLAVTDAERAEADPRYELRMGTWHRPSGSKCLVCMAGAVMAFTLDADPARHLEPDGQNMTKLWAIDSMREGNFEQAAKEVGVSLPAGAADALAFVERELLEGRDGETLSRLPWPRYREAARILREHGL